MSDYLWDRSGPTDSGVQYLEEVLGTLRYCGEPVAHPIPAPAWRRGWAWAAAAVIAAGVVFLVGRAVAPDSGGGEVPQAAAPDKLEGVSSVPRFLPLRPQSQEKSAAPWPANPTPASAPAPEREPAQRSDTKIPEPDAAPRTDAPTRRSKRVPKPRPEPRPAPQDPQPNTEPLRDPLGNPLGGEPSEFPAALNQAQVREAIAAIKPEARKCGVKHEVASGTRVTVQFTVDGATGGVRKAAAVGEYANTPVGACVARAAAKAQFPRVQKAATGLQIPFRLSAE